MEKWKQYKGKAAALFFWMGMLCELVVSPSGYVFGGYHEPRIIVGGMVCFSLSILCSMELKRDWWRFALLGAYGLACYYFQHSALVLRLVLVLLAGRTQDRKKAVQLFFWGTLGIIVLAFLLALFGIHNAMQSTEWYRHGGETWFNRVVLHPNGFSLFWMRPVLM